MCLLVVATLLCDNGLCPVALISVFLVVDASLIELPSSPVYDLSHCLGVL